MAAFLAALAAFLAASKRFQITFIQKSSIKNYTSKSNGFFAFTDIEPGYYVLVGDKANYEKDASLSFFSSGGTSISKELILRKERAQQKS